jgi:hypothetical protein
VKFQIPKEITDIAAVDKAGWTATKTTDTIEFSGGSLPADQQDHFDLRITAPATEGDVRFPIIQTCQQGELAWIEIAAEGQPEPEHPAPTLKITSGPPTSADLTPEPEQTDASTAPDGTAVILSAPATTTADPSGASNTGAVVGVVVAAVVVLGAGGWLLARRRRAD